MTFYFEKVNLTSSCSASAPFWLLFIRRTDQQQRLWAYLTYWIGDTNPLLTVKLISLLNERICFSGQKIYFWFLRPFVLITSCRLTHVQGLFLSVDDLLDSYQQIIFTPMFFFKCYYFNILTTYIMSLYRQTASWVWSGGGGNSSRSWSWHSCLSINSA